MRASWEALHTSLERSVRTLQAVQAFHLVKRVHQALAGFDEPHQLVAHLTTKDGDPDQKNAVLSALVVTAQTAEHRELGSALLWLGLWPGLDAVYRRRLRSFSGDANELVAELAHAFTRLIDRLDLRAVNRIAATLVRSTERDVVARRRQCWTDADHMPFLAPDAPFRDLEGDITCASQLDRAAREEWAASRERPTGIPFDVQVTRMRTWLDENAGDDAELLLAVLVMDETQQEAGARLGLSHDVARKRFQRALRRLRERMADEVSHSAPTARVCPPRNG